MCVQEYGILIPCPWRCCVCTRVWYFNTLSMEVLCGFALIIFLRHTFRLLHESIGLSKRHAVVGDIACLISPFVSVSLGFSVYYCL